MQDVDQRLTRDVDRLCTDLAELIPTMVSPHVTILAAAGSVCIGSICSLSSLTLYQGSTNINDGY